MRALASRLEAYRAKAMATGVADVPDVAQAYELAATRWIRDPAGWYLPDSS